MKISDLFLDYCEIEGLHIVRVLSSNFYFAINSIDNVPIETPIMYLDLKDRCHFKSVDQVSHHSVIAHFLRKKELENLQRFPVIGIPVHRIYELPWMELKDLENLFNEIKIQIFIREAQENICNGIHADSSQDDAKIVKWFKKAANEENPFVMFHLGVLYADGRGVAQDDVKAAYWYKKAANKNCIEAMGILSSMYESGKGVKLDHAMAKHWLNKALRLNDPDSMSYLIKCFSEGIGVTRNPEKAKYLSKIEHRKNVLMGIQIKIFPILSFIMLIILNMLIQKYLL